jgi:hypothetical protein
MRICLQTNQTTMSPIRLFFEFVMYEGLRGQDLAEILLSETIRYKRNGYQCSNAEVPVRILGFSCLLFFVPGHASCEDLRLSFSFSTVYDAVNNMVDWVPKFEAECNYSTFKVPTNCIVYRIEIATM